MSLVSILLGLGILGLGAWFVALPWLARPAERAAGGEGDSLPRLAELEAGRDTAYAALADLELDYRAGKVNQPDYQAVRGRLMARAVATLQQLDGVAAEAEREVEDLVRSHRRAARPKAAGAPCAGCGAPLKAGDRFCGQCGSPVPAACPACGGAIAGGDQFCSGCGSALPAGAAA